MSDLNNSIYERLLEAMRNENWTIVGTHDDIRECTEPAAHFCNTFSHCEGNNRNFLLGFTTYQMVNVPIIFHSIYVSAIIPQPGVYRFVYFRNMDPTDICVEIIRGIAASMRN